MKEAFLKACKGERPEYTPVWFMRQAGRYMAEYQKIRQKYDFLTMCKTPEIAAEVTMQPVNILDVDAAILFSDILIPLEAMGLKIEFIEEKGPIVSPTIKTSAHLNILKPFDVDSVSFVFETIKILTNSLNVPLIGFAASPFTLATYIIEGGSSKDFVNTKRFIFSENSGFHRFMNFLTESTIIYLKKQIEAGVHAVQIFDTWAGILSPNDYCSICKPYVKKLINELKHSVPVIYFSSNSAGLLKHLEDLKASVISLDWKIDMKDAATVLKNSSVQGNLDPLTLLGSDEIIFKRTEEILTAAKKARAHIFNLGHGVNINTSVEKLKKLVDFVHNYKFKEE